MIKVSSIKHLKEIAQYNEKSVAEFFIFLNGGLRSSKQIIYFPDTDTFDVYNEIDDSHEENLSEDQLRNETHIF